MVARPTSQHRQQSAGSKIASNFEIKQGSISMFIASRKFLMLILVGGFVMLQLIGPMKTLRGYGNTFNLEDDTNSGLRGGERRNGANCNCENSNDSGSNKSVERKKRNVVIASAFNHKADPQRPKHKIKSIEDYTAAWRFSIQDIPDMYGVVLTNMIEQQNRNKTTILSSSSLSSHISSSNDTAPVQEEYTVQFADSDQVDCIYTDPTTNAALVLNIASSSSGVVRTRQHYNINDQRMFLARDYLQRHKDELDYVLLTDVSDVTFLHNPFLFMKATDEALGQHQIYAGSEHFGHTILWWFNKIWNKCHPGGQTQYPEGETSFYNCGIGGAKVETMLEFLDHMCDELDRMLIDQDDDDDKRICDMAAFGHTILNQYEKQVITGFPFHNKFSKGFESDKERAVFIMHK